jgi:hypothetical protein
MGARRSWPSCGLGLEPRRARAMDVNVGLRQAGSVLPVRDVRVGEGAAGTESPRRQAHRGGHRRAARGPGWKKVQANPGCYVIYQASVKEQRSLQVWGHGGRFIGGMGSVDVKTVVNGMLVVDIGDASTQQLIWRAVARTRSATSPSRTRRSSASAWRRCSRTSPCRRRSSDSAHARGARRPCAPDASRPGERRPCRRDASGGGTDERRHRIGPGRRGLAP